jgi:NAD(P)-dependent dehydrogenase (short-subunit alcohol dehydrogenase family)
MTQTKTAPFGAKSTALEVIAGHDLSGKNAIVTGAYSGIGIETARALAQAGARVTIAVRDLEKGKNAAAQLRETTGNKSIYAGRLDLGDLTSVRKFAESYLQDFDTLSILINNAGIMACPLTYTADGYESQFATNHLGHFLLFYLLQNAMKKAAPARVVSLSSIGHRRSDIDFDDIHYKNREYDKWKAYGQSKTANVLFAVGLTELFRDCGVTSNAVMPGGIVSNLQRFIPVEEQKELGWIDESNRVNLNFKSPEEGASTSVWAAVAKELEGCGGLYLEDCAVAKLWDETNPMRGYLAYAVDPMRASKLWGESKAMVSAYI